jgi:glutamate/tyrosine decarboxylase-like PLP-dependent enzyme
MEEALRLAAEQVVDYHDRVRDLQALPHVSAEEIRAHLQANFDFQTSRALPSLIGETADMLRRWQVHTPHPRYFGLFNPNVTEASVAGDVLAAGFNPQLAAWSHSPAVNEIERHTLRFFLDLLGFPNEAMGSFTSGGAEANMSAVAVALTHQFPGFASEGVRALTGQPTLYISDQAHHSLNKTTHLTGIGRKAIRTVPSDSRRRMDAAQLAHMIVEDRAGGYLPLIVVGTAGTTGFGAIDPLPELLEIAKAEGLWLHVDAAWAGAALLSPALAPLLQGIEKADSATWDAHKWLSVPMAAGMFFCRHPQTVAETFGMQNAYMPPAVGGAPDPYLHTIQWSRRAIGLKVFMSLANLGKEGYRDLIEHQTVMGDLLRKRLAEDGWIIVNDTPLPLVNFRHPKISSADILRQVYEPGDVWISQVEDALRACITNHKTQAEDVEYLVARLAQCRDELSA